MCRILFLQIRSKENKSNLLHFTEWDVSRLTVRSVDFSTNCISVNCFRLFAFVAALAAYSWGETLYTCDRNFPRKIIFEMELVIRTHKSVARWTGACERRRKMYKMLIYNGRVWRGRTREWALVFRRRARGSGHDKTEISTHNMADTCCTPSETSFRGSETKNSLVQVGCYVTGNI